MPVINKVLLGLFSGSSITSLYAILFFTFCFNIDIFIRTTNSLLFQSVRNSNIGTELLFYFIFQALIVLQIATSDLQKILLGNHNATCIPVTSILEIGRIGKAHLEVE